MKIPVARSRAARALPMDGKPKQASAVPTARAAAIADALCCNPGRDDRAVTTNRPRQEAATTTTNSTAIVQYRGSKEFCAGHVETHTVAAKMTAAAANATTSS